TVDADTELPRVVLDVSPSPAELGSEVTICVSATDNVGVTDMLLTVDGIPVVVDYNGLATYDANHVGTVDVVIRVSDGAGNEQTASDTLIVFDSSDVNAPVVALTSPADGAVITAPTEVRGTASDDNLIEYRLSV